MRRKDREMPIEFARMVLEKCEFATLATTNEDGTPYCIPITIAVEGDVIYFHSARGGHKVDNLGHRPKVCLSAVGETRVPPGTFTTEFESAVVFGTAEEVTGDEERIHALRLICLRHTPGNMENFEAAIQSGLKRTGVWKIRCEQVTGKRKKYDKHGVEMIHGRME